MAKKTATLEVDENVRSLFARLEEAVESVHRDYDLKLQIEKDFRGKPVFAVRVRGQGVPAEMMKTLQYPEEA